MRHKEILRKAREHPPWSGRPEEEGRLRGGLSRPEIWHRLRPCAQGLRHRRGIRPCDDRVRRERDASSSLMPHMKSAPARRHPRRSWWPISSASRPEEIEFGKVKWPQMPLDRNITGREPLRLRNRPARLRFPAARPARNGRGGDLCEISAVGETGTRAAHDSKSTPDTESARSTSLPARLRLSADSARAS